MQSKSEQAFYVCDEVDQVSQGETFVWLNPDNMDHTISNCGRVLEQDRYTVPAHSFKEATVLRNAPHGPHQPIHVPDCSKGQPKIIIS
jgi:hypothetical protein